MPYDMMVKKKQAGEPIDVVNFNTWARQNEETGEFQAPEPVFDPKDVREKHRELMRHVRQQNIQRAWQMRRLAKDATRDMATEIRQKQQQQQQQEQQEQQQQPHFGTQEQEVSVPVIDRGRLAQATVRALVGEKWVEDGV